MRSWWLVFSALALVLAAVAHASSDEISDPPASGSTGDQAEQDMQRDAASTLVDGDEAATILSKASLELDDLFRLAELGNHNLASARSDAAAASGHARQVGLYPNPRVGYEIEDAASGDFGSRADKFSISQSLVVSGRLGASRSAALARSEGTRHHMELARRAVLVDVHHLWVDLVFARQVDTVIDTLLGQAKQTMERARIRYEARAAPESHVTKALVEVYEVESWKRRLTALHSRVAAKLDNVLGSYDVPLEQIGGRLDDASVEAPGSGGGDTADGAILRSNPAVLAARSQVEAARKSLQAARRSGLPDLDVSVSYGTSRPSGENFWEAGATLPLPLFDRNQGGIEEAAALLQRAEEGLRAAEGDLRAQLASVRAEQVALSTELDALSSSIAPAASRALSQAGDGYLAGRVTLLDLIDAQRTLADAKIRTLEVLRELRKADAELASLAGLGAYQQRGNHP